MMLRRVALALGVVVPVFVAGCSSDDGTTKSSGSGMLGQVQSAINKLEQDLKNPSGVVSASSAKDVFAQGASQEAAQQAYSMAGGNGFPSGSTGAWFGVPPGLQPMGEGDAAAACVSQSGNSATIDLGCLAEQQGGGTTASGSMTVTAEQDGGAQYVAFSYKHACVTPADTGATVCIDGSGAVKTTQDSMAFWADMTIDQNGASEHLKFGYKQSTAGGSVTLECLTYVGEDSYVLNAQLSASEGSISIRGKNGEFTCSYSNGGANGQCSSSGGETIDWGGDAPTG
jgi:hypothetical protein